MFLWLAIVLLALWVVLFRYRRRRMYQLAELIPGPPEELPVIGVAHTLTGSTEGIMESMQKYSYRAMQTNGMMRGWLNHILYFVMVNPMDVEVVLKTCMEKDDLHRFIRKIIGNGGIFAPVSIWRRRRKILVPAFSPKIVENFVEVFSEQSVILTERLKEQDGKGQFSAWPYLSTYTLDSVFETAMGVKINAQNDPKTPFLTSLNMILNLVCERIFKLWLQPDWMYKFFPQYTVHQKCLGDLHRFIDNWAHWNCHFTALNYLPEYRNQPLPHDEFKGFKVILNKRRELKIEDQKPKTDSEYDLGSYKRKTFLDLLITLSGGEKGYTDEELREEVLTLTIAGTDTSAVASGYALKLLAKYPEVQEKLYQELYDVFGDSDRPLQKDDMPSLKYLERVVKETVRLFPPVPFIIRKVLEDTKLPSGSVLPAGSGVVISIWGIHRDYNYWGPTAEHFDPDRFLPERLNLPHPCCFIPFSHGPRNCPGYQYALMSVKTAVSSIVRQYRIVGEPEKGPIPQIKVKLDIMMKAVDGYQISLEKRQNC